MTTDQAIICETNLIAAYIDGELDENVTLLFEQHLQGCADCRTELREHRLFVCELDAALMKKVDLPVPADFSRVIAARASSDMSGVRTRSEHKKAFLICLVLGLTGFALAGATARDSIFFVSGRFVTRVAGVGGFLLSVVYDAAAGVSVIFRAVGRKIVDETGSLPTMVAVLAVGVVVLSRLISHYHRPGATE
jgi:anti-sigma factor RsiW